MLLALVTPPVQEPLELAEAKQHLRVLHDAEDTLIGNLIKAARLHTEATTGRALITQTWDYWLSAFPRSGVIELPRPPLVSVAFVKYRDSDGTEQTLDPLSYLAVVPGIIGTVETAPGASWPATQTRRQAVNVRFVAGYGDNPGDVPEDLRTAMLLLIDHLYYNRGATTAENLKATPMGVDSLLAGQRTFGWGPSQVINVVEASDT